MQEAKDWARLAIDEGKKKDAARIYTKALGSLVCMSREVKDTMDESQVLWRREELEKVRLNLVFCYMDVPER